MTKGPSDMLCPTAKTLEESERFRLGDRLRADLLRICGIGRLVAGDSKGPTEVAGAERSVAMTATRRTADSKKRRHSG